MQMMTETQTLWDVSSINPPVREAVPRPDSESAGPKHLDVTVQSVSPQCYLLFEQVTN